MAYTTRLPRPGEQNGVDYHFVCPEQFKKLADGGAFLEHKEVHGYWYATPLRDMEQMLAEGKVAILKIDVKGALTAMELRPDALSVFLLPPSWEELEKRIRGRGTDDAPTIEKRLRNATEELEYADKYRFRVTNDDLHRVVNELEALIA